MDVRPIFAGYALAYGAEFFSRGFAGFGEGPGLVLFPAFVLEARPVFEKCVADRQMGDVDASEFFRVGTDGVFGLLPEAFGWAKSIEGEMRSLIFAEETTEIKAF